VPLSEVDVAAIISGEVSGQEKIAKTIRHFAAIVNFFIFIDF
jgi:hypothetical protein